MAERDVRAANGWVGGRARKVLPAVTLLTLLAVQGCQQEAANGARIEAGQDFLYVAGCLLAGAIVGAFFSQRLRKFRALLVKIVVALVILSTLLAPPPLTAPSWFMIGAVTAWMLLRVAVIAGVGRRKKSTEFGTAEWATLEHLEEKNLIGRTGYVLGYFQKDGVRHPIHYTGDRHLLTVAPTRAGKGVSAIIPNLLRHAGSAFVIDPKGENARVTAKQRAAMGQRVHVVDPWGITGMPAARFNPLDWLDPQDENVAENAYMLADALILRSSKGENSFWDDESASLLWGLILYVALDPRFASHRNLGTVRDMMNLGSKRLFGMLTEMYQHDHPIISSTAERTLAKDEKTRANVFTSLQSQTVFLDSPKIRASLASSDFKFEDLKATAMTVYLVLPADRLNTFGRWLRLLIQQAITCNARNLGVKPAGGRPILFLLDEMAALGKLTKVEEAYGLMAGFGMQLWGIVQDLSQLDRIYDKGWETFIGNSGVLQYFGSRDEKTATYFSKLCGMSTIEKFSITRSISRTLGFSRSASSSPGGGGSSSSSDSTTTGTSEASDVIQRPLAFPDELMRLEATKSLVLIETFNPIDARKVAWFEDDELAKLGVNIQGQPLPTPLLTSPVEAAEPFVIPGTDQVETAAGTNPEPATA